MPAFTRHYPHWPPSAPKSLTVPHTGIHFNLEVSTWRYPQKTAITYYGGLLSYARLAQEVDALAGFLQQRCGVARGDRVLLYAQNSPPQFIVGYYAILRTDAVVVPVNPVNKSNELAHYSRDSDARVALAAQELYREIEPHLGVGVAHCILAAYFDYAREPGGLKVPDFVRAPRLVPRRVDVTLWSDVIAAGCVPGTSLAGPDDLAVLPYTSGTTGLPKAGTSKVFRRKLQEEENVK